MKAIIPVAGIGKRLRPHTYTLPKVLIKVAGKPILGHILDGLIGLDIGELVIILGDMGKRIEHYVGESWAGPARFIPQEERLGLGHAVYLAMDRFKDGGPCWIIYGDTIFEADLSRGLDLSADGCLGVKEVEDPRRFGIVELDGEGNVKRLVEKPAHCAPSLAIVGVNFIRNTELLFDCLSTIVEGKLATRGEFQLTDAFQLMVERGACLTTFPVEGWFDCGRPETLLATNRHLLEKNHTEVDIPGSTVVAPVYLAPTARVENSVLGPHVSVGDGVMIRNCVITDTIINEKARLENLLLKGSLVGEKAVLRGEFAKVNVSDSSEVRFAEGK